jgi:hypothetical protein
MWTIRWYLDNKPWGRPEGRYDYYVKAFTVAQNIAAQLRMPDLRFAVVHDTWHCWRCRITRMAVYLAIGLMALVYAAHYLEGL